jgi:hypothetical protein
MRLRYWEALGWEWSDLSTKRKISPSIPLPLAFFFASFIIYMGLVVVRLSKDTKPVDESLKIKISLFVSGLGSLLTLAVFALIDTTKYYTTIAFCEWLGTVSIILFCYSFRFEFGDSMFLSANIQSPSQASLNNNTCNKNENVVYVPTYIPVPVSLPLSAIPPATTPL